MKRSVTLDLGGRKYTFLTSDPQELVDQVFSKITEMYNSISKNEEEVGYEKLLVGISVNLAHDLARSQNELLRLKAKYEEVLSEYFQGRDEVEK
ncbi:cell division protein ZapA [Mesotoga sp. Brook.08.YT.4.2.5.1]|uniref:Cell division protein ZapA n=1 Tax=Mesotoga prima TaxID=1184387 RepID=A0A117M1R0_9BACT|nr:MULTISPECIES: cell division protein ZapA [unclassified Mesotoga]KUK79556.1 MAG: Cell division protein ZapA [Mesotoga prima]PNE22445.1 cell division protein ZapA [Mesotoga sp. Brook.08.YT.4.2.5.1]PNS40252.1 cell division protein ZapA [Mesotoga sp. B105.6.4]PVD15642.1 cell division protein ZapA [Mesotoga sp. Brook.08.105.5.1]RAO98196.1 cell division protein ZapA [Mesotoga sp. Brook.08.YT.4.2.5.4.]